MGRGAKASLKDAVMGDGGICKHCTAAQVAQKRWEEVPGGMKSILQHLLWQFPDASTFLYQLLRAEMPAAPSPHRCWGMLCPQPTSTSSFTLPE